MKSPDNKRPKRWPVLMLTAILAYATALAHNGYPQDIGMTARDEGIPPARPFTQQQLDQMLAPIALYPDELLSQILMASTYPLEVVEAARWSRANPRLSRDDAVRAVQQRDWDPSVKSLTAFPRILQMMDEKLEWTENLGDAFLEQQAQILDTVQHLRQRAYAAGNLKSNNQVRVENDGQAIVVVPANPDIVYVPYYDPMVVYGTWWWPDYPPVFWPPWPGYFVVSGFAWGAGIFVTPGFFFGGCDWRHHRVIIINVNNNYYYYPRGAPGRPTIPPPVNRVPGPWHHDPAHRRGVPYRDIATRNRFRLHEGVPEFPHRSPVGEPAFSLPAPGAAPKPVPAPGEQPNPSQALPRREAHRRLESEPGGIEVHTPHLRASPEEQAVPESRGLESRQRVEPRPAPRESIAPEQFERRIPGQEGSPGVTRQHAPDEFGRSDSGSQSLHRTQSGASMKRDHDSAPERGGEDGHGN